MPYLLDKDVYEETKEIVLGKRAQSPLVRELADWCKATYGVTVLNLQYRKSATSRGDRSSLDVILKDTRDHYVMKGGLLERKPDHDRQVAEWFRELALKHQLVDRSELARLFVVYTDYFQEARKHIDAQAEGEIRLRINDMYPMVWHVSGWAASDVVFFYTDADVGRYADDGTSAAITETYYAILKQYDDLDVFTRDNIDLRFDSKENVDKNYQGNLFFYFR